VRQFVTAVCVLCLCASGLAKDKPLVAIVLSTSTSGPAWAQLSDFLLNGKREVYACTGEPLDGNAYRKLPKVPLVPAMTLEREAGGMLVLVSASGRSCVLPVNLKLEKKQAYALKDLVDTAQLDGRLISKSDNAVEPWPTNIPPGTQIHLLEAPDDELAEYLRAGLAQSIPLWQEYLRKFPAAPHVAEARHSLATLVTGDGQTEFAAFRKSLPAGDYAALKRARARAQEALRIVTSFAGAERLLSDVEADLRAMLVAGQQQFSAFVKAMGDKTPGYAHLKGAQLEAEHLAAVDPACPGLDKLRNDIDYQQQSLDSAIASAQGLAANKSFDQAYAAVARYMSFAGEIPAIAAVSDQAYASHRDAGQEFLNQGRWEDAIKELRRALHYREDAATSGLLKRAEAELESVRDRETAQKAIDDAGVLAAGKQFIDAYQTLESLPDRQRQMAAAQMDMLRKDYLQDLLTRANTLVRVHLPIRGRADENAVRQAHDYLQRASKLEDQDAVKVKLDVVSDRISEYYLKQAQRALGKPRGSGIGLGWLLLKEGERFKSDHDQLRNHLTRYAPEFETRSRLSLAVRFRDQTSRRESLGFADQLADAVAAGLENSGLAGLKILPWRERPATETAPELASTAGDANFHVLGNIVQHRVDKKLDKQPKTSHYRAGYREIKNPAWIEAKRQLESAQQEYERAQAAQKAEVMNKKELAESNRAVELLAKKLEACKAKLDEIPETQPQEIIQPYNYLRQTIELAAVVEISFRLFEPSSTASGPADSVRVEVPKTAVLLENVKPEDVDGVVEQGVAPDENQLLAEAETKAQAALLAKLVQRLGEIPAQVLEQARAQASRGDTEAAAEKYVLFLNITPPQATPERSEAQNFLRKEFNVGEAKEQ